MVNQNRIFRVVGRDSRILIGDFLSTYFTYDEIEALEVNAQFLWRDKIWLVKKITEDDANNMTILEVFMFNDSPNLSKPTTH